MFFQCYINKLEMTRKNREEGWMRVLHFLLKMTKEKVKEEEYFRSFSQPLGSEVVPKIKTANVFH
jgi:hypothetical protein